MQTEFGIQRLEHLFILLTDVVISILYRRGAIFGRHFVIPQGRTYVLPAVVVRQLAEGGLRRATRRRVFRRNRRNRKVPLETGSPFWIPISVIYILTRQCSMDTKAFSFNCSAKYRAGGHYKEKSGSLLSLTDQQIIVDDKRSHFQATFPDVFADYQNPRLQGASGWQAWHNWKSTPFDWWQCQLNFIIWCSTAGCGVSYEDHLQYKDPFLRACIDSMPPIRPDVSWRSCASPFPETRLTSGTRTLTMPGPTSGSAPSLECHLTLTGGRNWTMSVKGLAHTARTWSCRAPTATRTKPRDRWTPSAITATSHEPGRPSPLTTRTPSL